MTLYRLMIVTLTTFLSIVTYGQGDIAEVKIDSSSFPKGINYEGKIKNAVRWTDKMGDNIVILSETGICYSEKYKSEEDERDAELFAYHFLVKGDSAIQTWRVYDYIADCPVDLEASYVNNTFQVTDLNNDGVGEVWMVYKTVCHGDVSPWNMKIIMYQGQQKYAMRGQNKVPGGIDEEGNMMYLGGDYIPDKAFTNGPKVFLNFAKALWDKNVMQIMGE